jgi:hypothetical protein
LLNTIGARIIAQPNDYYLAGIDQPPNVLERTAQHRGHFRHAQQVGHLYRPHRKHAQIRTDHKNNPLAFLAAEKRQTLLDHGLWLGDM